jgi:tetratricopeptide (TPR) repeat protein
MAIDVTEIPVATDVGEKPQGEKATASRSGGNAKSRVWIYRPAIDLLIGCAGWSAPLLILLYFTSDYGPAMSIAFYELALLFNYPHYSGTIYRAYRTREDLSRYRLFTIHLTLIIALAGTIAHCSPSLIPWVFTIYISWSPWHYSGQNFGLALMFARRAGVKPTRAERNALYVSFLASYALVFLTMHSSPSTDPYVLSLGIPTNFAEAARPLLAVVFGLAGPWALYRLGRRGGWRLIIPPATLFATQFLWFVLPFVLQMAYKIDIPQTRYSAGILAVMHSAQYVWITSYYARREAIASGAQRWRAPSYFASLIIGGIALFLPGPWVISYLFHYDFTSSMLIFTAIVNIHHFLLDGAIWKLREGRIAEFLISSRARVSSSLGAVAGWIASRQRPARIFRLAAAALLVLLAVADQARFFLAADASDASRLARAERLNPYDAAVHANLARTDESIGDVDQALAEFQRAVRLNPRDADARAWYVRLLLENQRYQEAYDQYKLMAAYVTADADSFVNFGILADRLGHPDEAIANWNQAVRVAPHSRNAHLYLADALFAGGKPSEAVPHYEQYLALLTSAPGAKPDPQEVVRVVLRVGDVYTGSGDFLKAFVLYHNAVDIAKRSGIKGLESLSLEHAAYLYAVAGQRGQAADLHRRALQLDADAKDDKAAALDWFAYAQFLNDAGQPKTMVLACTLKSESLLAEGSGEEADAVRQYMEPLKASLGSDAVEKVRQDTDSLVDESLKVKF